MKETSGCVVSLEQNLRHIVHEEPHCTVFVVAIHWFSLVHRLSDALFSTILQRE